MSAVDFTIQYFPDPTKGRPLFNGQIYIGIPDLDPQVEANQKQVYLVQENGDLVTANQPILLSAGGVPLYNGSPVTLDTEGSYSIKVLDKLGAQVYYIASTEGLDSTDDLSQTYTFHTVAAFKASLVEFPVGKVINVTDYATGNNSSALTFNVVVGGAGVDDGGKYIDSDQFTYQLEQNLNSKASLMAFGLKTGVNNDTVIENAIAYYDTEGGATLTAKPGSYPIVEKIELRTGLGIEGDGVVTTFDDERVGVTFTHAPLLKADIAIQMGQDGTPTSNRATKLSSVKVIGDKTKSIGVASVNTDIVSNTVNSINWSVDKVVAEKCLIGFDIRNTWNYEVNLSTAVDCDIGFRLSGATEGAGTSNNWESSIAYVCRIGFDFEADGWAYSSMKACGVDTCDVALKLSGASSRGSSIENFGIEGIGNYPGSITKVGVLVDYVAAGHYDLDGLHFAIHDAADITYIVILNNRNIVFRNVDVPSSVLNSCKLYNQTSVATAGSVKFMDCSFFGADMGDIFEKNVLLVNTNVNGRVYRNAVGGFDSERQAVTYSSAAASASNNPIYSQLLAASPDSAFDRIFTGTPSFDATKLNDYDRFTIVNTHPTNKLVFRTETSLVGSGIVRNATINPANDITLTNEGDSCTLEKRADGKLYQIAFYTD